MLRKSSPSPKPESPETFPKDDSTKFTCQALNFAPASHDIHMPVHNSSQRRNLLAVIQLITYRPPFRVGHGQFEVDSIVVDVKGTKVAVDC